MSEKINFTLLVVDFKELKENEVIHVTSQMEIKSKKRTERLGLTKYNNSYRKDN